MLSVYSGLWDGGVGGCGRKASASTQLVYLFMSVSSNSLELHLDRGPASPWIPKFVCEDVEGAGAADQPSLSSESSDKSGMSWGRGGGDEAKANALGWKSRANEMPRRGCDSSRVYVRPPRSGRAQLFGATTIGERSYAAAE